MTQDSLAHQLFNAISQPSILLKADAPAFTIVAVNEALLDVVQRTSEKELIGQRLFEAFPDNPNDINADGVSNLKAVLLKTVATSTVQEMPVQKYDIAIPKSGRFETRYWLTKNTPIINDKGIVDYILHTTEDVTEKVYLKQKEEKVLLDVKNDIANTDNLETSNAIGSWDFDIETEDFYWSPEFFEICGYAPNAFKPSLTKALEIIHPSDHETVIEAFNNALVKALPYRIEHRIITANNQIITVLATGIIIKNKEGKHCRLTGIFQNITGQKQQDILLAKTLQVVSDSEKRYKQLFENNPSPMFIWDFKTLQIIDCNEEALLLYGYSKEEFLTLTVKDIRPTEDIYLFEEATRSEDLYGPIHKKVWRHKKKNGEIIILYIVGHLFYDNGRKVSLVSLNNVTEKIKSEEALKESELKLKTAQQVAKLGYWDFDFRTDTLIWSDELYQVFGANKETFLQTHHSFVDLVDEQDRELVLKTSKHTQETGNPFTVEYHITTPDGEKRVIQEHGYGEMDNNGKVMRLFGTAQNITERKLIEEQLRESIERYKYVTKATSDAIWDWDLQNNKIYWGEGFETIFGYKLNEIKADTSFRLDHTHPDDVEDVMAGLYYVIYGKDTQWEDSFRFRKADGSYAYVTNKGFVIRDSNGTAIRMVGAKRDITKHREEELRLKLLESVVTNATDMVAITDADEVNGPRIVYVNDAYTKITGYTLEEAIGKTPRILQGPKTDRKELDRLKASLIAKQPCAITVLNYKKNGEEFWSNISISPVKDANNTLTNWIAIKRDTTKQKEEEERLKLLESVVTNATDMVLITEAESIDGIKDKIIYANEAFTTKTGYTSAEIIGKTPLILQGPKTDRKELDKIKNSLEKFEPCNVTVVNYTKNGEEYWVNMSISPVADLNGKFTHQIAIERDITEQIQHESDILQAIIKTQEEERYEVGGELHDNVCQILTSTKIVFKMLEKSLPDNKLSLFNDGIETLSLALKEIRNLSHRLAPVFFDESNLEIAFINTLKAFNVEDNYTINVHFDNAFKAHTTTKEFQLNLYRILQEQLNNIFKYAKAHTITVEGSIKNNLLVLSISDDGIGFNTNAISSGIGLSNMKRRAELFKGTFTIKSAPGEGCTVLIKMPI